MQTTLSILNGSGDTKLTWDSADPASCEDARRTVAALRNQGYSFFLVDGRSADEVTAGDGELVVRRLSVDEVVHVPPMPEFVDAPTAAEQREANNEPPAKRRGRPPKAKAGEERKIVAVRPLQGG